LVTFLRLQISLLNTKAESKRRKKLIAHKCSMRKPEALIGIMKNYMAHPYPCFHNHDSYVTKRVRSAAVSDPSEDRPQVSRMASIDYAV
jgi:hypothetical protein